MKRFITAAWILAVGFSLAGSMARAEDKKTERTWKAKCSSCHGPDGKGDTEKGKKMKVADYTSKDWQGKVTDDELKKAISEGVKKEADGVKKEMDPFKDELKPEQIDALVKHIRSLAK